MSLSRTDLVRLFLFGVYVVSKWCVYLCMEKTQRTRSNLHLSEQEKELARQVSRAVYGVDEWSIGLRYLLHEHVAKLPANEAKEAAK